MTFADTMTDLGESTADRLEGLYARFEAGALTLDEYRDLAADVLTAANARGWTIGVLGLTAYVAAVAGEPVAAPALPVAGHYADRDRLRAGVETITGRLEVVRTGGPDPELEDIRRRLRRIGKAEPVEASQRGYSAALEASEHVNGWVRSVEPDACELCQWWAFDGRVWPASSTMQTHTGCACSQIPVVRTVQPAALSPYGPTGYYRGRTREQVYADRDETAWQREQYRLQQELAKRPRVESTA